MQSVSGRIAALYDIHGNLPALEAVLRDVCRSAVEEVVIGGDIVPGPMPREVLELLLALDIPTSFIHGNGDREVLAQITAIQTPWYRSAREEWRVPIRWSAEQLQPYEDVLASWPSTLGLNVSGIGDVLFCHATPQNDVDCFTRLTPDARVRQLFAASHAPMVVCGHTHMQFDRRVDDVRIVNAGSVGMPFGEAGAYWLLLDLNAELRRTEYDLADASARIRATEYPQAEEFAAHNVLDPPSEDEMLEIFSRADTS